ncbi:uncharacterized protein MONBRDRAFT_29151 [Monosiga brevicollis MX1]|uniref:Protein YIPF n=1 Tax=Monosiga brevicollis TaxID=81824 RepID=A9VA96_MONBE|nr:uncharacterized protein MONBRDRAFT_29151 [Monosiga brevicollis MX1]EDQ85501.1 predicted protein [Monosiga brevicollis MX1]|eukprot:XP_001749692.1 hypothetical protein [Monosiga brevicollis MX1]
MSAGSPMSPLERASTAVEIEYGSDDEFGSEKPQGARSGLMDGLTSAVGQQVAANMFEAGKQSAESVYSSYARIDLLRPYFDVEPADIRYRLLKSLWPQFSSVPQIIPADLYGPIMLAFTLSAILLLGMKAHGHVAAREGTLIGTAFAVAFGFWATLSTILYTLGFIFNTNVTAFELVALTGYSMFSYCIVLLISHLHLAEYDFYMAWLVIGSLAALRLGFALRSRTPDGKQGIMVGVIAATVHWTYLLYLKLSYVTLYNAIV